VISGCRCLTSAASSESARGHLHDQTVVVNALRKDQVLRGVTVAHIDENGHGVVGIHVRKDKQSFEFAFARTLPGERLNLIVEHARHDKYKKKEPGKYRLLLEERGAASLDEVTPRCAHFSEKCGGCAFQHFRYEAQVQAKHSLLCQRMEEYRLDRGGPEVPLPEPSPSAFGFHGRTEFRFFLRDGIRMGLHPVGNPVPISISQCHLHPEASHRAFQAVLDSVRAEARATAFDERTGRGWLCSAIFKASPHAVVKVSADDVSKIPEMEVLVTLVTIPGAPQEVLVRVAESVMSRCKDVVGVTWSDEGGEPASRLAGWRSLGREPQKLLAGRGHLTQHVLGVSLEAAPEAFSRPNQLLADAVASKVVEFSKAGPEDIVWDTFCGQGSLSLPLLLARGCRQLVAFDRSEPAILSLRRNTALHNLEAKVQVVQEDLGSPAFLRALAARLPEPLERLPGRRREFHRKEDKEDSEDEDDDDVEDSGARHRGKGQLVAGSSLPASMPRPDVLLADPGRNGLPKAFRRYIFDLQVPRLVYIGSGKAFLRDITLLVRRGYELQEVASFDSHPHNARLEVVASLQWNGVPEELEWEERMQRNREREQEQNHLAE
ncbi:unnamed protein product, partial [Polarella glacialis]